MTPPTDEVPAAADEDPRPGVDLPCVPGDNFEVVPSPVDVFAR